MLGRARWLPATLLGTLALGCSDAAVTGGPSILRDHASGLTVRLVLRGPEGRVARRTSRSGLEDRLYLAGPAGGPSLSYTLDLSGAHAPAGLRLLGNVVELLDADGVPRLRMDAPLVLDADGREAVARVDVTGCSVDTDPAPPWGRPVTPAGAYRCSVRADWSAAHAAYPLLLVSTWTTTTSTLSAPRRAHTATRLPDGRVLVAGGEHGAGLVTYLTTAEVFDPATDTWAATGPMATPRSFHGAALLDDGRVLVAGGQSGAGTVTSTAEAYTPSAGTWASLDPMSDARRDFTLTATPNGRALAAGGKGSAAELSSCEVYFPPSIDGWGTTGSLPATYSLHTATLLGTGDVLLGGGLRFAAFATRESHLYDTALGVWSVVPGMRDERYDHAAALLDDGTVLLAGSADGGSQKSTAEVFDPSGSTFTAVADMAAARKQLTLTAVPGGAVAVGGRAAGVLSSAEIYDSASRSWGALPDLETARTRHTATLLDDGRVLVAGGEDGSGALSSSELLALGGAGDACTVGSACLSGHCVEGVCCDSACGGLCEACTAAKTGGADGTCAPVAAGTDPDGECTDDGSPSCAHDGFCDGSRGCESYPVATGCTPAACTGDGDCTSGHCADGICCDSACDGTCEACTAALVGAGADGVCGPISAGTDPEDECPTVGSGTCRADGVCDGSGACQASSAGTSCGAASCTDATTLQGDRVCTGQGSCATPSPTDCAPYVCSTAACVTSCSTDADCAPGLSCTAGSCEPLADGNPCTSAGQCSSGFCVDGVCCESECGSQCEACDVTFSKGSCAPVTGEPHGARPKCPGSGACRGECDGTGRRQCVFAPSTKICSTACDGATVQRFFCDGVGTCNSLPESESCAPYGCDPGTGACRTTCSTDSDCTAGVACVGGACGGFGAGGAGAGGEGPGGTSAVAGAAGAAGSSAPAAAGDEGGCGCRVADRGRSGSEWIAFLVAVGGLVFRRRRLC